MLLLLPVHLLVALLLTLVLPGVLEDLDVTPVGLVEVGADVELGLLLLLLALLAKVEVVVLAVELGVL